MVRMFCPSITTGLGLTAVQAPAKTRFVVDCNRKPAELVGHVKTTFVPERTNVSCGGGNERLKTVPYPAWPPPPAVPKRVLPDKTNPVGKLPSLFILLVSVAEKVYSVVKPLPLVSKANTVPLPKLPPRLAIPYSILPDTINPLGLAPSLLLPSALVAEKL